MSDSRSIDERVSQVLVESLNIDEIEVKPAASLKGDLGAESIDFLDIVFRLEREFDIKIPRGELFPESIFQGDPEFVQDGQVTDKGIDLLRTRMPYADLGVFEYDRRLTAISDLFTFDLITRYVAWKLRPDASAGSGEPDGVLVPCSEP
jgi:acyl carrier protein